MLSKRFSKVVLDELWPGFDFFSRLPDKIEERLENRGTRKLWSWKASSHSSDDDSGEVTEKRAEEITRDRLEEYPYVALKNSGKFHENVCRYTKKIPEDNLVGYRGRKAALKDGREPCGGV